MHNTPQQDIERMLHTINWQQTCAKLVSKLSLSSVLASLLLAGLILTQNIILSLSATQATILFVMTLIAAPLYTLIKQRPGSLYTARWVDTKLKSKDLILSAWQICQDTRHSRHTHSLSIILNQAAKTLSASPDKLKITLITQGQALSLVATLPLSITALISWPQVDDPSAFAAFPVTTQHWQSPTTDTLRHDRQMQLNQLKQLIMHDRQVAMLATTSSQPYQSKQEEANRQPQLNALTTPETTPPNQLPSSHVLQTNPDQETTVSTKDSANLAILPQPPIAAHKPTTTPPTDKEIFTSLVLSDKMYLTKNSGDGDAINSVSSRWSTSNEAVKTFNSDRSYHSPLINHLVKQYLDKQHEHYNRQASD